MKQLDLKIDLNSTKVKVERYIGKVTNDYTEGGSIDVLLKDSSGKAIIIENKIYAKDQKNQLVRYYSSYSDSHILYLTLYGNDASKDSKGSLQKGIDYTCISYKNHILKWLEECRKEVAIKPLVRETIAQYIFLIKHLTGQTINNQMDKEIIDTILSSEEVLSAWKQIASKEIRIKVKRTLVLAILERIKKTLTDKNFAIIEEISLTHSNTAKYRGLLIAFDNELVRKNELLIRMNFEDENFRKLIIGFYDVSENKLERADLFEEFNSKFPDDAKKSELYPAYIINTPYSDWWTSKLKEIYFHYDDFENDLISKIDKMIMAIGNIKNTDTI